MKLINYFYLSDPEYVFTLFRYYFPKYIAGEPITKLVDKCLAAIPEDVRILEWFLFEERDVRMFDADTTLYNSVFYFMSSDEKLTLSHSVSPPTHRPLGVGFYAVTMRENIRLTVDL